MNPLRILLADDHALVRAGLRSLLQAMPEVEVVGDVGDGRAALELIASQQPDLVLMDIAMPELNGIEAVTRIKKEFPKVRVIILSMYTNEEYVQQALRAGVAGYLLKDAAAIELELAIQAVKRGETYLSPAIAKHVVAGYVQSSSSDPLTARQKEILRAVAEGLTTQEIAQQLNISVKTVETHRTQLMDRLDIHDVPGLVRYAIRVGLVKTDR